MQRIIITIAITFLLIGILWPWISKLGLGRLPGDIAIDGGGFRFYLPITTMIIVSALLSLVIWIVRKF